MPSVMLAQKSALPMLLAWPLKELASDYPDDIARL